MPSPFAALEDQLSDAIDGAFAEAWTLLPMRRPTPNSRSDVDPDRTGFAFDAVFDNGTPGSGSFARLGGGGGAAHHGGAPQFTTSSPTLHVETRRLNGVTVQRLDRVVHADTGDIYEITDVKQDGQGRQRWPLVKVGKL